MKNEKNAITDQFNWENPSIAKLSIATNSQVVCKYFKQKLSTQFCNLKKRIYYLIDDSRFVFIHYLENNEFQSSFLRYKRRSLELENKEETRFDDTVQFLGKVICITDIAPEIVKEFSSEKVIIIFESLIDKKRLKGLENQLRVKIANTFVQCKICGNGSLIFYTPSIEAQKTYPEIYIKGEKISFSKQAICLEIIKPDYLSQVNFQKEIHSIFHLKSIFFSQR